MEPKQQNWQDKKKINTILWGEEGNYKVYIQYSFWRTKKNPQPVIFCLNQA